MKYRMIITLLCLLTPLPAEGKKLQPKTGELHTHESAGGKYSMDVLYLGHPDTSPSRCTFRKEGKVLWQKELETTPAKVRISDDGEFFAFLNYYNYDENWLRSVTFYAGDGTKLKEIVYWKKKQKPKETLKDCVMIEKGAFLITAPKGKSRKTHVKLISLPGGKILWSKVFPGGDLYAMRSSASGDRSLLALYDILNFKHIWYYYFEGSGKILWKMKVTDEGYLEGNLYPEIIKLPTAGKGFSVMDPSKADWLQFHETDGKVVQEMEP